MVATALMSASLGCRATNRADGDGRLLARSQGEQSFVLRTQLATALYAHEPDGDTIFVLSDLPREELLGGDIERGQVLVLDLLWPPKAGSTPINGDATNTSIRQLVAIGEEAGSYAGAGFAMPSGSPETGPLRLELWDTTIRLESASPGFLDMLSPATVTGAFTATRDDAAVRRVVAWMRSSGPSGGPLAFR